MISRRTSELSLESIPHVVLKVDSNSEIKQSRNDLLFRFTGHSSLPGIGTRTANVQGRHDLRNHGARCCSRSHKTTPNHVGKSGESR
jgi:hypothetical protein